MKKERFKYYSMLGALGLMAVLGCVGLYKIETFYNGEAQRVIDGVYDEIEEET